MSKHAIGVTLILCLVPSLAIAQATPPASAGVLAGVNFGSISGLSNAALAAGTANGANLAVSGRTGGVVGAFYSVPFDKNLALDGEVLFVQKGGGASGTARGISVSATFNLSYLEIPILVKYTADGSRARPYFFAGPSAGFKLSANVVGAGTSGSTSASASVDVSSAFKATEYGIVFGGGVQYGRLMGEARYTLGLTDVSTDNEGINNRSVALLAGVRF